LQVKRNTIVFATFILGLALLTGARWDHFASCKRITQLLFAEVPRGELGVAAAEDESQALFLLKGKLAPGFTLEDLNGRKVSLGSFKGKAVLLNFWATWCAPCKIETPWLIDLRTRYAAQGFEVLGISADDLDRTDAGKLVEEKQRIAHSAEQMHIPYPVLFDGASLSKEYGGLDSLPTSVFVDHSGRVVAVQLGLTSKKEIEGNILKALGK
jgi:cytochrome c biogenesis protein CcmG/thiol:disulfide interchange protein DsbE